MSLKALLFKIRGKYYDIGWWFFKIILKAKVLPKKVILKQHDAGFFSNFNKVINYLIVAEQNNVKNIEVDWCITEKMCRAREAFSFYGRPGDGNIWKHFFKKLLFSSRFIFITIKTNKYWDMSITDSAAGNLYTNGKEWRGSYNTAFKKYIRLQPHIQEKVDHFYSENMADKYCIGAHLRSVAHANEQPSGKMPALAMYIERVKDLLQEAKGKAIIYLATDVEEYIGIFSSAFSDKVVYQLDAKRMLRDAFHWSEEMQVKAEDPSVKRAEEILIDCLLLAKCDIFIHTVSNIATAVGYINPEIPMVYLNCATSK